MVPIEISNLASHQKINNYFPEEIANNQYLQKKKMKATNIRNTHNQWYYRKKY